MFKLSEIAEKFKIDKVKLIELLMDNKLLLNAHTEKKIGITYVDDRGIEILYNLLFNQDKVDEVFLEEYNNNEVKYPKEFLKFKNKEDKIIEEVKNLKLQILKMDSEIQKKDSILIEYQEKLLDINKSIIELEEDFFMRKL